MENTGTARNILLIDAYSQIFRCFYAIAHLSNSRGEPTNAVFAFTRLLINLEREFPGSDGALCFDCGKPAFRLALAPEYKAGRPPMPEELARQMPVIRAMAAAFGWPLLQAGNYEADDLIGGFAAVGAPGEREVFIVSSDKDLAQLVRPGVTWLAPDRKATGFERRGGDAVTAKFGVAPGQMVDYLALLGDSSDNIPGVPGVGAKTAAKILAAAPDIDAVLAQAPAELTPKILDALRDHLDLIRLNRQLIRLRTELPPEFADVPGVLKRSAPDWAAIAGLCRDQELNSLLRELPADAAGEPAPPSPAPAAPAKMVQGDLFG